MGDFDRAAANRASVRRMAASLTIPWARKHKCTVKEAMLSANQSKEARLEMLSWHIPGASSRPPSALALVLDC